MNRWMSLFLFCAVWMGVVQVSAAQTASTPPKESGLLQAWEQLQREDAQTLKFERLDQGLYHFHTQRFPYDGQLRVLNLSITPLGYDAGLNHSDLWQGVVEVELPEVEEAFYTRHSHSYSRWTQNNYFYYDSEQNRWLSPAEWSQRLTEQAGEPGGQAACVANWIGDFFWLFLLVMLLFFLIWIGGKSNKQIKANMEAQDTALKQQEYAVKLSEEAVELSRESNRLLQEMLEILKKKQGD